jgi:hypothetical protein
MRVRWPDEICELQNRHPTLCRDVDGTNDNNVVALNETLTDGPLEVPLGRRLGAWLAILVGESESACAVSCRDSEGLKGIHRPPDMMCKHRIGDGIMCARFVTNINMTPELAVTRLLY